MKRYETRDDHNRRMPTCLIHNIPGNDIAYLATTRSSKEHYPNKSELHWYANDDYRPPFCLAAVKAVTEGIKRSLGPEKTPQLNMPLQAASHINFMDDLMETLDDDDLNHIHEVTESALMNKEDSPLEGGFQLTSIGNSYVRRFLFWVNSRPAKWKMDMTKARDDGHMTWQIGVIKWLRNLCLPNDEYADCLCTRGILPTEHAELAAIIAWRKRKSKKAPIIVYRRLVYNKLELDTKEWTFLYFYNPLKDNDGKIVYGGVSRPTNSSVSDRPSSGGRPPDDDDDDGDDGDDFQSLPDDSPRRMPMAPRPPSPPPSPPQDRPPAPLCPTISRCWLCQHLQ